MLPTKLGSFPRSWHYPFLIRAEKLHVQRKSCPTERKGI